MEDGHLPKGLVSARRPELYFTQFDRLGFLGRFGSERLDGRSCQPLFDILSQWPNCVVAHILDEVRECLSHVHGWR